MPRARCAEHERGRVEQPGCVQAAAPYWGGASMLRHPHAGGLGHGVSHLGWRLWIGTSIYLNGYIGWVARIQIQIHRSRFNMCFLQRHKHTFALKHTI
jgi:hypothetical protein